MVPSILWAVQTCHLCLGLTPPALSTSAQSPAGNSSIYTACHRPPSASWETVPPPLRDTHHTRATTRGGLLLTAWAAAAARTTAATERIIATNSTPPLDSPDLRRTKEKVPRSNACDSLKDGRHDHILLTSFVFFFFLQCVCVLYLNGEGGSICIICAVCGKKKKSQVLCFVKVLLNCLSDTV